MRIDSAPGLLSLKQDTALSAHGITLDYGRVKNLNKNPVAEKCNQELELELLHIDPTGAPVTDVILQDAVHILNSRVRNRGLSAREILFCRDQITSAHLNIDDNVLNELQQKARLQNHTPSARSKGTSGIPAIRTDITAGSLVYMKKEGNKFQARDSYMVVDIKCHLAILQKITSTGKFMSRKYEVPIEELFLAVEHQVQLEQRRRPPSSSEDEGLIPTDESSSPLEHVSEDRANNAVADADPLPRSVRFRRELGWLRADIWDRGRKT